MIFIIFSREMDLPARWGCRLGSRIHYLLIIILGDLIAYRGGIINLKIEPI